MKNELISQYHASLKMLSNAIDRCPDQLWGDTNYQNSFRRIAYHTLHYTALYLAENEAHFSPWRYHVPLFHRLGEPLSAQIAEEDIPGYTKENLLAYTSAIRNTVAEKIRGFELTCQSGFDWLPMNNLELLLYNLRHLQHHTGQLVERLHQNGITGIAWIDSEEK